jgi:signal recognition particle receptor subunit beta
MGACASCAAAGWMSEHRVHPNIMFFGLGNSGKTSLISALCSPRAPETATEANPAEHSVPVSPSGTKRPASLAIITSATTPLHAVAIRQRTPLSSPTGVPIQIVEEPLVRASDGTSVPHAAMADGNHGMLLHHPPSVGIAYRPYALGEQTFTLLDFPGQLQWRSDWWAHSHLADAIVYCVDSSDPEMWAVSRDELSLIYQTLKKVKRSVPVMILCTKQDTSHAATPEAMVTGLRVTRLRPAPWAVHPCSVLYPRTWQHVLDEFMCHV